MSTPRQATKGKKLSGKEFVALQEKSEVTLMSEEEKMIVEALQIQANMSLLKERQDEIKDYFKKVMTSDKTSEMVVTAYGSVERKTTNNFKVDPNSINSLEKIFGKSFNLFVEEKIEFKPKSPLKELLFDGDYEHRDVIRKAITVNQSVSITFSDISKKN